MRRCSFTQASAQIRGDNGIRGTLRMTQRPNGTLVTAEILGLPHEGFFALHIHAGPNCGGVNFANTGAHWDLAQRPHPDHTGDLPPLLSCHGRAYLSVLTDRFCVAEAIGRTVVIHANADDFTTQPSGNSGQKIACGIIQRG